MSKRRFIIVTPDTIYRLLQQYLQGVVPETAVVTNLQYNPQEKGAIRLHYTALEKPDKAFIEAKFDLRQTYGG